MTSPDLDLGDPGTGAGEGRNPGRAGQVGWSFLPSSVPASALASEPPRRLHSWRAGAAAATRSAAAVRASAVCAFERSDVKAAEDALAPPHCPAMRLRCAVAKSDAAPEPLNSASHFVRMRKDPPKVQPFQFPSRPQPNRRIRLTCTVTEGDPPLRFTWLKDDVELTSSLTSQEDSGDVSVDVGPESSVLVLRRLHVGDIGNYTCVVDNPAGTDKFQAFLRFPVPPFWKADPEPVEVLEGQRAVLSCSAGGYPEPQILWRRRYADGVDRAVVKTSRVRVAENSSLVLESVSRSDQGSYVCQAHNGVPPDVQRPVALKVR
ncbi:hypothetical protein HPB47_021407, partial [Ixodes persulcatus]